MARVVFMGTPQFAVPTLQALDDGQQVVGVVTQPDRPAGRGRKVVASPVKESIFLKAFKKASCMRSCARASSFTILKAVLNMD